MASLIRKLPMRDPKSGLLNVVVDTPKGNRNKNKFDEKFGHWRLKRILPEGMSFPYDFGFIPSTQGVDGDPIDVHIFADEPTFVVCVVPARLIGVFEAEQTEGKKTVRNDRLAAVIETPRNPPNFRRLHEVGNRKLKEIEQFFVNYNQMEGRSFKPVSRGQADRAQTVLREAKPSST